MKDDDLYPRYQTLSALINVLLHDLRNPLHSATLLVEAMGTRTADVDALRGKLRGQFGKLDGLIAEASDAIKEIALESRVEDLDLDELLRAAASLDPNPTGPDATFVAPAPTGLRVSVDRTLFLRAISEVAADMLERHPQAPDRGTQAKVELSVDEPDGPNVRVNVGDWRTPVDDFAMKSPFAIAGGGIRLALSRGLAQLGGATLRLEQSPGGGARFAVYLRRAV